MKAVALISGGIDSPVAVRLMMDRGIDVHLLHGIVAGGREKIKKIASAIGNSNSIRFVDQHSFLKKVVEKCDAKYTCILCKRHLYKEAEKLCKEIGADFIITGESLGQVASQTLANLKALEQAVSVPVVRPLIGLNKDEIVRLAKAIGTYEISIRNNQKCPFVPRSPSTSAKIDKVLREEEKLED